MGGWTAVAILLASYAGQAPRIGKPVAMPRTASISVEPLANFTLNVSPATITFQAMDPDVSPDAGSSAATVSWTHNGTNGSTWNLTVRSAAATMTNCPTVAASSITVTCTSARVTGTGGTAACSGAFALSTTNTVVASGKQPNPSSTFTVTITYSLADNWKRIAQMSPACSLSLTYIANQP